MPSLIALFTLLAGLPAFAVLDGIAPDHSPEHEAIVNSTVEFVKTEGNFKTFCSGTITGKSEVVTAGHCVLTPEFKRLIAEGKIFIQMNDPKSPGKKKRIKVLQAAGEYDPKSPSSDLAVVKLAEDVPAKNIMRMASGGCDDGNRIAAGFGVDGNGLYPGSVRLARYTEVSADEQAKLLRTFGDAASVKRASTMKSVNGRICNGDSGGPVFCKSNGQLVLAGVNAVLTHASRDGDEAASEPEPEQGKGVGTIEDYLEIFDKMKGLKPKEFTRFNKILAKNCRINDFVLSTQRISEKSSDLQAWVKQLSGSQGSASPAGSTK